MKLTIADIQHTPLELPNGHTLKVTFEHDDMAEPPHEGNCFYEGLVRTVDGYPNCTIRKRAGEVFLYQSRGRAYIYDLQAATKRCRHPTISRQLAAKHAYDAGEYIRQWLNDQWHYTTIDVKVFRSDGSVVFWDCLGGVETYKDYHLERALEMAVAMLAQFEEEQNECAHWEARDTVTL